MIKTLLLSLLISISAQAQVFEASNQSFSIRSKDKFYGGELDTSSMINPMITGRYDFFRVKEYSYFVEGKAQYIMLNGKFSNGKQFFTNLDLGFKLRLSPRFSMEFLAGYKDLLQIESSNGAYSLNKVQGIDLTGRGSFAFDRYGDFTLFAEGLVSLYPSIKGVKGNDIGVGIAMGHYIKSHQYLRVGYRLEYDLIETPQISNGIWKNTVYVKINF